MQPGGRASDAASRAPPDPSTAETRAPTAKGAVSLAFGGDWRGVAVARRLAAMSPVLDFDSVLDADVARLAAQVH